MEASKPTPKHSTEQRPTATLTILHAERAGVLKDIPDIRTSRLGLEGVEEGSCCALHNPTDGLEVIGLDTVEIPTEPWGQGSKLRPMPALEWNGLRPRVSASYRRSDPGAQVPVAQTLA